MKRTLLFALSLLAVVACRKFDDSAIWKELNKHEDRIVKLETLCNQMNTNITSLQTIIIALQRNDYVVNIAPIMEGNKEIGYTLIFSKSGSITIYHGKDGENGKDGVNGADGKDGQDGKDGYSPKIGVKQHTDGKYYWTLDGNWILDDNSNMISVTGEDGKDGANGKDGKDGITPQLKIEDGYWYLSYDNGATWQKLGKATGNNGLDGLPGEDGDSIIDSITQDEDNVYFKLTDGQVLTIMKRNSTTINFRDLYVEAICVRNWDANKDGQLSYSEAELVTSLNGAFTGNTNVVSFEELKYFTRLNKIEAQAFKGCTNLWRISLPANITIIESEAFYECSALNSVEFPTNSQLKKIGGGYYCWTEGYNTPNFAGAFAYCSSLESLILPTSINLIENAAFYGCSALLSISLDSSEVPTLDCTSQKKGKTDPSYHFAKTSDSFKILVPEDYLNQYKTASGWKSYSSILMGM
ncbi:bNR/Asp-box repeat protein [Bacteroides sp. CAG:770]|nr:bNR/Asp-box repeat protein [Bacteroides sp. CAG:770]